MSFTLVSNTQTSPTLNRHLVGETTTGLAALPPTEESEVLKQQKKVPYVFNGTVTILDRGEHYVVVAKPPTVICHHSEWSGSRSKKRTVPEVPMLQRTREAVQERVNLVHRLDRGASGCLLLTMAKSDLDELNATATLQEAMTEANKTYVALVRGEGLLNGRDLKKEGWFEVNRPIKDESGKLNDAITFFRFVAGQDNDYGKLDRPRASVVLCRPKTGRWHQIRRHLKGLSHPILGDSYGNSETNREWRNERGLAPERTCLHLLKLELPKTYICPSGIDAFCPLADDMMTLLKEHLPDVLKETQRVLKEEEGIDLQAPADPVFASIDVPIQFTV
jgi:tRNA pseudouridine65 synthase